jgi:prepilin-type N-terminal cleavage/methylation domain-containing protein
MKNHSHLLCGSRVRFLRAFFAQESSLTNWPTGNFKSIRGFTLPELMIVVAILGLIATGISSSVFQGFRSFVKLNNEASAVSETQQAMILLESDLEEMTRVTTCTPQSIVFQMDSNRFPGFNGNADPDGDGIINDMDIDDDRDMTNATGGPVPSTNFNGNDLWDQDDDNDGNVDVQCMYFINGGDLFRDFNYNQAGWGINVRRVLRAVTGPVFEYVGSVNRIPGPGADLNGDGIVTRIEIDAIGNGNSQLDTPAEMLFVDSIVLTLQQDQNGDGTPEFNLRSRIRPPLLSTNRRVL